MNNGLVMKDIMTHSQKISYVLATKRGEKTLVRFVQKINEIVIHVRFSSYFKYSKASRYTTGLKMHGP